MNRHAPTAHLRAAAAAGPQRESSAPRVGAAAAIGPRRRRVRVLYVLDNLEVGGSELNAARTAARLDRSRFDIEALCFRPEGPVRTRYEAAGVPVTAFPIAGLFGPGTLRRGAAFAALVRQGRFDIVHAHDRNANIFAAPWTRCFTPASIIASRRWWTEIGSRPHRLAARAAFRLAHRVLVNSPAIVRRVETAEGVRRDRIVVVSNFVDDEAFEPPAPQFLARTRAELGLTPDTLALGIIANLRAVKNHALLLDAAARLASRWPQLRVILVGEGELRDALEAQAAALGLANRIVFAGFRPHHPSFHHLFDISVLTSDREGFPNAIVEAMAAGRPVISTNVGGVVDAVVPGETGLLVPAGDAGALSAAIEELLRDPARRRGMGAAGLRVARERFSASRVLGQLQDLYETLAGSR
ncbi:MAG TPA: glycosyltransferase [Vicinamibacterales bacterium]|nr:glycosyltransferase [Vicinamibacterales bacterium]